MREGGGGHRTHAVRTTRHTAHARVEGQTRFENKPNARRDFFFRVVRVRACKIEKIQTVPIKYTYNTGPALRTD